MSSSYTSGDYLVKTICREVPRRSVRPTQYIVNDGTLVIDDKSLRHTNSVIYNRPGSTLIVQPGGSRYTPLPNCSCNPPCRWRCTASTTTTCWTTTVHTCRGCSEKRQLWGGYCRYCIDARTIRYREPRLITYR
jgi:hypothetical protein